MSLIRSVYFAHPTNTFHSELERRLIAQIRRAFPGDLIVNPADPVHEDGYRLKKRAYFVEDVLPGCRIGVVLPFPDEVFGAGVWDKLDKILRAGGSAWTITHVGLIFGPWDPAAAACLGIEETRARTYLDPADKSKGFRPYL